MFVDLSFFAWLVWCWSNICQGSPCHFHILCTYRRYRILLQRVNKDISTFAQLDLCRKPALLSPCSMICRYNLYACWLLPFPVNLDYWNLYIYRDECKFADSLTRSTLICQIPCRMQYLSPPQQQPVFLFWLCDTFWHPISDNEKYMKTYIFRTYIQETYTCRLNLYLLPPSIKPSFRWHLSCHNVTDDVLFMLFNSSILLFLLNLIFLLYLYQLSRMCQLWTLHSSSQSWRN